VSNVVVVDVCSGNLRSVARALAAAGADVVQTQDPKIVRTADKLVVPGQGAFGTFMRNLNNNGMGDALREWLGTQRPYLGICLGMQILFDVSEEQGPVAGLGIIPGRVHRLPTQPGLKIPHMGWNQIKAATDTPDPMLRGIANNSDVYFVHSYAVSPTDAGAVALTTDYGGAFCSAVRQQNLFACQFHPEKSQSIGITMLRNFVEGHN
jgi:imidazole glycerol-phosphate synthase subunit HisH